MRKLIHHTWPEVKDSRKMDHKRCPRCLCEKFWSFEFNRTIYINRHGTISYRAPSCELENVKL